MAGAAPAAVAVAPYWDQVLGGLQKLEEGEAADPRLPHGALDSLKRIAVDLGSQFVAKVDREGRAGEPTPGQASSALAQRVPKRGHVATGPRGDAAGSKEAHEAPEEKHFRRRPKAKKTGGDAEAGFKKGGGGASGGAFPPHVDE